MTSASLQFHGQLCLDSGGVVPSEDVVRGEAAPVLFVREEDERKVLENTRPSSAKTGCSHPGGRESTISGRGSSYVGDESNSGSHELSSDGLGLSSVGHESNSGSHESSSGGHGSSSVSHESSIGGRGSSSICHESSFGGPESRSNGQESSFFVAGLAPPARIGLASFVLDLATNQ